jgi:ERCC4-type nuclease
MDNYIEEVCRKLRETVKEFGKKSVENAVIIDSVEGYEKNIVVERKSKADLFQSVGRDRQRLQKEFERLTFVKYSAIVVEADWREIERKPENTIMNPSAVRNTIFSWSLKYNVIPILASDRREAERLTFEFLAWAWRSLKKGEKKCK